MSVRAKDMFEENIKNELDNKSRKVNANEMIDVILDTTLTVRRVQDKNHGIDGK